MKRITLLFLALLPAGLSYGQATEYSLHLTSGFSAFRGPSAPNETVLVIPANQRDFEFGYMNPRITEPFAVNPFGRKLGLAYGAAGQVQRISAANLVFGVQAGYEVLRSRTPVSVIFDKSDAGASANGHATLANSFINLHAFLGHRFTRGKLDYDLTTGPEIGWLQRSHESAEATVESAGREVYTTDLDRSQRKVDVRARVNLTAYYQRLGFSVGYSLGLSKYRQDYISSNDKLYSQVFRTGIAYRLTRS
ncbi:hypothetical protein E5K02_22280 [Hymenobacter metallicola]|uniref:Outer membrane protein beta-barrel domain-containing protein n=2 Tax=Hymenobacter metallicola TaxID=2563114 RepID=A0A4Z0Q2X8_9BACT|nr:hypothetical protein E5K02_22280 [Hymenobacter metallicola]